MKLSDPYPYTCSTHGNIILVISISIFVGGFLAIFQPFGLGNTNSPNKELFMLGYGLVNLIILSFDLFILPLILPGIFAERKWTVLHQIFFLLFILFTIGLGNYYYTKYIFNLPGGVKAIAMFQLYTLVVGIFPVTFLTLLNYNRHLKRNLEMAGNVRDILSNKADPVKHEGREVTIPSSLKNEEFRILLDNLFYLQSEGNYIRICHLREGKIEASLIRSTMKTVESNLRASFPPLIRSHRSYIVNSGLIQDVSGNSQGLLLKLKGLDEKVPVSRGYVDKIRSILS